MRILLRAFRPETWRETAYLVLGLPASALAFAVLLGGVTTGLTLALAVVGVPVLIAVAYLFRWVARIERRRTSLLLRETVEEAYRPAARGLLRRVRTLWGDPQTWKDFAWLCLVSVIGFGFAVAAGSLWASALYLLTFPIWWSFVPDSALPDHVFGSSQRPDTWGWAAAAGAVSLAGVVLVPWLNAALAHAQARLARALLSPSERARLRVRVGELGQTRAAAADAQVEELRRIERDLHDGAQARLVALAIELGRAKEKLVSDPGAASELVASAHEEAKEALAELRELVRGVHPAILDDRGLDAALSALAARSPIPATLDVEIGERLPPAVEIAAYFVVAEALANAAKHSGAAACAVRVRRVKERLSIEVVDDGAGGIDPAAGTGVSGLEARVRALDGTLSIDSPHGGPSVLRVEVPCAS
jgi:signal transduction histidine kinase